MSSFEQKIASLSTEKLARLQSRLHQASSSVDDVSTRDREIEKDWPVSFAQQRLWFLDRFEPASPLYNVPGAVRMMMPLHVKALEAALNEIVRRHESLRTVFVERDGLPVQRILPQLQLRLPVIELGGFSPAVRESEAQRLATQEGQRPFDLTTGPLLRASLLRLGETDHVLLLTMHHIVSDGWSMTVFFRELSQLYEAYVRGEESPLAPLPVQYADFAQWQRNYLQGAVLESELSYWREQLAGAPAVLELPTDRARPAVQSFRGAVQVFAVSGEVAQGLKRLSQEAGATLFMTLLAAFKVLLYRYTGQGDLVVGTPIANRPRAELEGLIGFFVNTLVLRTRVEGELSFRELLERVKEVTLAAYARQDLPFEKLVEELHPQRSLSHNPLFQVMFSLQTDSSFSGSASASAFGQSDNLEFQPGTGTAKFDLTLIMYEKENAVGGALEYNVDLFEASTIERLLAHFQRLLDAIVAAPGRAVASLPLLNAAETRRLLVDWNDTAQTYAEDLCVHELFERQVERTPQNVALAFGDQQLTFAELNERADELARRLSASGIGPETLAGIYMDRSVEMILAVIAVLKAGGAYVPLDPGYPPRRIEMILEEANPALVLTQQHLRSKLNPGSSDVICVDEQWDATRIDSREKRRATPANLAYVLYTSGSTGRPKGVAMSHAALQNLLSWQINSSNEPLRTLQYASLNFDVSFQEIFSTLCAGGTLVLISESDRRDPSRVLDTLARYSVERLFLPYVALKQIADFASDFPFQLTCLKEIITAGEQLRINAPLIKFVERLPGCTLVNQYGPTETHVATAHTLQGDPRMWPELPPIGRPIGNAEGYVLDEFQELVALGVVGELYVGGRGVARGYLQRPDLTAERFIPDRFSGRAGARLYRTGDLVRYREDGELTFAGRAGQQVKVRGYRVELGEIETVLSEHASVGQAAVALREDKPGEPRLAAYVTAAKSGAEPDTEELRNYLKQRLPEYMAPASIMVLAQLPLSPNGKLDRRQLPVPEPARRVQQYVAPRTELEEELVKIWQEVLSLNRVGVEDNFFDLGGHSLVATRMVSRVRARCGVELPLQHVFERPTISALAPEIAELQQNSPASEPGPIKGQPVIPIQGLEPGDVNKLSDSDVESLLAHLLEEQDANGAGPQTVSAAAAPPKDVSTSEPTNGVRMDQLPEVDNLSDSEVDALLMTMLAETEFNE